ncbi:TPA: hypothetical protein I7730_01000 [Vibrio vulnificus]|uniref:Uncharacterized protein n=1 Tax=Vibrio vulnificus TaxID=672 RepID=A0A8H9MVG7_VIBVL|nr:hypothetical protein [Vibrio vulnificus]HAS8538377.1 hypothetical protein [Vibrio vulnificus]
MSNIAYQASIINAVSEVFENKNNNPEYNKAVKNAFKKANINSGLDPYTASVRMSYKFDEIVDECVKAYGASRLKKNQSDLEAELNNLPVLSQKSTALAISEHFESKRPLEGEYIHHNPFADSGTEVEHFRRGLYDMEVYKKTLLSKENLLFIAKHSALFGLSVSTGGMAAMYGPLYYAGFKMLSSAGFKAIKATGLMDKMVTAISNRMLPLVDTLKSMPFIENNPRLATYVGALAVGAAILAGSLIGIDAEDTLAATNDFKDQLSAVDIKGMTSESMDTLQNIESEVVKTVSNAIDSEEQPTGFTNLSSQLDDYAEQLRASIPHETCEVTYEPTQSQNFFSNLDAQLDKHMSDSGLTFDDSHGVTHVNMIPSEICEITVDNIAEVSRFDSTEMPSHKGGLWGVLDDQLESSGIKFETEQEKNAAIVELINAVAEQNPDISNIHDIKAGQAINLPVLGSLEMVEAITEDVSLEYNVLAEHINPYDAPSATEVLNNKDDLSALTLEQMTTAPIFADFKSPDVPEMGSKTLAEMNLMDITFGSEKEKAFVVDSIAKAIDETMATNGGQPVIFDNLSQDHIDYIIENGGIENYEFKEPTLTFDNQLDQSAKVSPKMKL